MIGQNGRERVNIVAIYPSYMWVGNHNEGEVSKGLQSIREPDRQQGQGEVGRGEQGIGREWRTSMPVKLSLATSTTEEWELIDCDFIVPDEICQ